MTPLEELATRCEAASGADREMDADILEATGGCAHRETERYVCQDDSGFTCLRCGKDTYGERVPKFTASLDAAMTLVPEGWAANIIRTADKRFGNANLYWFRGNNHVPAKKAHGAAATPALALTAACLKARAMEASNG